MRRFTIFFLFFCFDTNVERDVQFLLRSRARKAQQPGKLHSKPKSRERETKERERESKTLYTKGTTPGGTRRLGSRFQRIWECSERSQSGFFYTFQARVGGRRCRSYIKSQVGRTNPRRGRRKPRKNKSGVVQRCTELADTVRFCVPREWCVLRAER